MEKLVGAVERVTFHNPDNGFAVLRVSVPRRQDLVVVVGNVPTAAPGESIEAEGTWTVDPAHGPQFKADTLRVSPPTAPAALAKFLGSGVVQGIGPTLAERIVAMFGERTLAVMGESPAFLRDVPGIGKKSFDRIVASWKAQQGVRQVMLFLHEHGLGTARALRIHKLYGDDAIRIVKANPYKLADDIAGIGFRTADALAQRLGLPADSPLRKRAALRFALHELAAEGHTGFPQEGVAAKAAAALEMAPDDLLAACDDAVQEKAALRERCDGEDWLFLPHLHQAELDVAKHVFRLASADRRPIVPAAEMDGAVAAIEADLEVAFSAGQREALRLASHAPLLVVTGGPGVGKTTLVKGLLKLFDRGGLKTLLAAPTGRAAKRMAEATGRPAATIHRLLEYDGAEGGFGRDRQNPLDAQAVVLDEASMLDVALARSVLQAIPTGVTTVLVGDIDQLPSVGPGSVLADIIHSDAVSVVRLSKVFRQGQGSRIIAAAHAINAGEFPPLPEAGEESDFHFVPCDDPAEIVRRVVRLAAERIPAKFGANPIADVQTLAPMRRGPLGALALNAALQAALNPGPRPCVERFGTKFQVGDRVIQTENDYERQVFNGDLGRVCGIDEETQELAVDFEGRALRYAFGELDALQLAYCLTIHKSQGSEYPFVIVPLHTSHFMMLRRNLLYTAATRGKKMVVVVGSRRAVEMAIQRADAAQRCGRLKERLQALLR